MANWFTSTCPDRAVHRQPARRPAGAGSPLRAAQPQFYGRHRDGRVERRQLADATELHEVLTCDFRVSIPHADAEAAWGTDQASGGIAPLLSERGSRSLCERWVRVYRPRGPHPPSGFALRHPLPMGEGNQRAGSSRLAVRGIVFCEHIGAGAKAQHRQARSEAPRPCAGRRAGRRGRGRRRGGRLRPRRRPALLQIRQGPRSCRSGRIRGGASEAQPSRRAASRLDRAGRVIGDDRVAVGHEVEPVDRLVVRAHVVVALGRARVVVERDAGRDDVDERGALVLRPPP